LTPLIKVSSPLRFAVRWQDQFVSRGWTIIWVINIDDRLGIIGCLHRWDKDRWLSTRVFFYALVHMGHVPP
jgi:hypothetical protein